MRCSIPSLLSLAAISFLVSPVCAESFPSKEDGESQQVISNGFQSKADILAEISQVLSAYGIFLDQGRYDAFPTIFTDNIYTNLFGDPPVTNIKDLIAGFKDSRPFVSQHISSNEFVYELSPYSAKVTSYSTVYFFGEGRRRPGDDARGPGEGQLLTFFDAYDDVFVNVWGKWKISQRIFRNLVSF